MIFKNPQGKTPKDTKEAEGQAKWHSKQVGHTAFYCLSAFLKRTYFIYSDRLYFTTAKKTYINAPMLLKKHRLSLGADMCSNSRRQLKWITTWHPVSERRKTPCEQAAGQLNVLTWLQHAKWSWCCFRGFYLQHHKRLTLPTVRVAAYYFTGQTNFSSKWNPLVCISTAAYHCNNIESTFYNFQIVMLWQV